MQKKTLRLITAVCILLFSLWTLSSLIASVRVVDRDDDGVNDSLEGRLGTNPMNVDTDFDGITDGVEYNYWMERFEKEKQKNLSATGDADNDGVSNILDYDSDNDMVCDGDELKLGTDPADPDTDDDGRIDGQECTCNHCCGGECGCGGKCGGCCGGACRCGGITDPLIPDTDGDGIIDSQDSDSQGNGDESSQNSDIQYYETMPPEGNTRSILRYGYGGNPKCYTIFNPSLDAGDRLKRWMSFDAVTTDYNAYIANETKIPLELSDSEYEHVFHGSIPLRIRGDDFIAIPSVSPTANIISYTCTAPEMNFEFYKDRADNYYVKPTTHWSWQEVNLTILTSAPPEYYRLARSNYDLSTVIPATLNLQKIPENMKHTPPSEVCVAAAVVVDELGLTGETNVQQILSVLIPYFNSFTEGDIPSEEENPDAYLATALSHHGACYVRSFAFFVTANAIGIPTRLVTNDCHAFVEVYIPTDGWMMIDLGGLGGGCIICNRIGADLFDLPSYQQPSENGSDIGKIETVTTLTYVSSSSYIGGSFVAEGNVKDRQHHGVANMSMKILVNTTKGHTGTNTGNGITDADGNFIIHCIVPDNVPVGTLHVIAWAQGNSQYNQSWSDPIMEVFSNTTMTIITPTSIGLTDQLQIRGMLLDVGGKPASGRTIAISWNGSLLGTAVTDDNGIFSLVYTPTLLGKFLLNATFNGEHYLSKSSQEQFVYVRDKSTRVNITVSPEIVTRGGSVVVTGSLTSETNERMSSAVIKILFEQKLIQNITTDNRGDFSTSFFIPNNTSLGNRTIHVWYPGTDKYAEANMEHTILVQSETRIAIMHPTDWNITQNTTFMIVGQVFDDQNHPLQNMHIDITGTLPHRIATTGRNGTFNTSIYVQASFPTGKTTLDITCAGNEVYRSSYIQSQITITSIEPSRLPVFLSIAAASILVVCIILIIFLRKRKKRLEIQRSFEEIIAETLARLQTETDHRKTVLDCYRKMYEILSKKGVNVDNAYTPREFALVAREYLSMPAEKLYDLTKVFEKARYSQHEINEYDRDKAIRCLRTIVFSPMRRLRRTQPQEASG